MVSQNNNSQDSIESNAADAPLALEAWVKPEIVSFQPVSAAQGSSLLPGDGTSNLS